MQHFIEHLMRGGDVGYYWLKQSKKTFWWNTADIPVPPENPEDIYFGVHPSGASKGPSERTLIADITAINCLYADIDSKDHTNGKGGARAHVQTLNPRPSVIIDSGGGYHCYWLLSEPFILDTDFKREAAQSLQDRWVTFVGGDKAVHDLARILRVPGTSNFKYDPPEDVKIVAANYKRLYTPEELGASLPMDVHRGDDVEKVPPPARPNSLTSQEIVDRARDAKGGAKFVKLWQGSNEGFDSASEADQSFCCLLAFWTGGDYDKIDKLFRASRRMRDKWEREKYRRDTILKALGQVTAYYVDPGGFLTAGTNDEGNAQCVRARVKNKFLFCEAFGWMRYLRNHWASELAESAVELKVAKVLKERRAAAAQSGVDEKLKESIWKVAKPSNTNIRNCKSLLRPMLAVEVGSFDVSLDELNCPNGVLNLRTGVLSPHNPARRFSYCIPISYDPEADSSVWAQWLLTTTGERPEVVNFLQQAVGYSLTGHTREEKMFYIYGPARGGKGVFTETLIALLGGRPLATEVGMEMFLEKRASSGQGFDLAALKATRLVAASESKESHWLDAPKIKRWTGGNYITCAHKYGRQFTYKPRFKIWLTSNFALQMDADDTAGWARVQVIKFPNSYLGHEDKMLKTTMRSEEVLQGVLRWAVEGAMAWYKTSREGLVAPTIVQEETQRARESLDWVSEWVREDVMITGGDEKLPSFRYFQRYSDWCNERGVKPKSLRSLNKSLRRHGYVTASTWAEGKQQRCWVGATLVSTSFRESLVSIGE